MRRFLLRFLRVLCVTLVGSVALWIDSYWHRRWCILDWLRRGDVWAVDRWCEAQSGWGGVGVRYRTLEGDLTLGMVLSLGEPRTNVLSWGTGAAREESYPDPPNPDDSHPRGDRERLYFEAMMRVLDRELPGYRD